MSFLHADTIPRNHAHPLVWNPSPSLSFCFFFFNDTATTEIYTLSLHDALPISLKSLQAHAQNLSSGQYIQKILRVEIQWRRGKLQFNYHTDAHALERLTATTLGRRILFTDNHEWTTEDIILAYRSQYHVEAAFRTMKNPHFVGWEPMYHWTDQKIRVHALYCVMALTLAGLLQREAHRAGLELSLEALGRELSSICEVINLYAPISGKAGRFRAATTYTEPTPTSSRLAEKIGRASCRERV